MPCYCNAPNVLEATTIAVVAGTSFTITYVPSQTMIPNRIYLLDIPQTFPAHNGDEPVTVTDGAATYPLLDNFGDIVYSGQLEPTRCRPSYRIGYGANGIDGTPHFVVFSRIPNRIRYNPTPVLAAIDTLSTPASASTKGATK